MCQEMAGESVRVVCVEGGQMRISVEEGQRLLEGNYREITKSAGACCWLELLVERDNVMTRREKMNSEVICVRGRQKTGGNTAIL